MSDLTDFLLARIAEDEAAASKAGSFTPWTATFQNDNYGHLTVQPDRVLGECEAKRRIVEMEPDCAFDRFQRVAWDYHHETTLRFLALPYADHPDYREEWKP